jgi:hypothetical protein
MPVPVTEATKEIIEFYKTNLMQSGQLITVLGSYTPFKKLGKGVSMVLGPVYKPIIGAKDGSVGVASGLSEGIEGLMGYLSEGSYGLGIYLLEKLQ